MREYNYSNDRSASFGYVGNLAHGPVLKKKYHETSDSGLADALLAYEQYISDALSIAFDIRNKRSLNSAINLLTEILNNYRNIAVPIFEKRPNSGQENLRSTILEEFFQILLYPLTAPIRDRYAAALTLGKANSYVGLNFTPRSFIALYDNPNPNIHTKDQDFVLGCAIQLTTSVIGAEQKEPLNSKSAVIPAVAIECKTYIERNMLDSCAGTARRLKTAMPYCLYIVAAEYMKMEEAYPELTDINELFILTKKSNAERTHHRKDGLQPHPIYSELIQAIFEMVASHLKKIWWSPEDALKRGRVIGRP